MNKLFLWKQTDSVDGDLLDRQHQELFQTVQELYDALKRADGLAVAEHVFSRLIDYSTNHFAAEEALMQKQQYPAFASHRAEHQAFTRKLLSFQKSFQAGNGSVVSDLLPYLQAWIKNHVQNADHQYGEFLKANDARRGQAAGR
jgi:hemerythrin